MPNETTLREFIREIVREELREGLREIAPQVLAATVQGPTAAASTTSGQLWNAAQAADYLGVSTSWVYHRSAEGSIPCVRVGHALRFDPAALAAWTRGERRGGRVVPLK